MKGVDNSLYRVGIYARLSKDDYSNTKKKQQSHETSGSIVNQISILTEYVKKEGWTLVQSYQDDGYGGGDFDRPAFKQLIVDARLGCINLILVKDLSRFGRNAVGVGAYTEEIFPSMGCRFVSLGEGIDTLLDENEMLPFYATLHDFYRKDLSKKIKKSLYQRARDGTCILGSIPYGYQKAMDDKHRLVIDPYASQIIKQIFALRLSGRGYAAIAGQLNKEHILPPRIYWKQNHTVLDKNDDFPFWREATVKKILANDIYTGSLTQRKTNKDATIRIENAHTPIIEKSIWEKANNIHQKKTKKGWTSKTRLFTSMLICGDCGSKLIAHTETHRRKNSMTRVYTSYHCPLYYQTGRATCSSHTMYEIGLTKIIQEDIKEQRENANTEQEFVSESFLKYGKERKKILDAFSEQISDCEKGIESCQRKEMSYFEERMHKGISEEIFECLMQELYAKQTEWQMQLEGLKQNRKLIHDKLITSDEWTKRVGEYKHLVTIDRELIEQLINQIEVGERRVIDDIVYQSITVCYQCKGTLP